ncbi:MAG TPA: MarR family transcriptional regulator [Thermoleophilia bacterium]|nr:MarR family transcriptional regulator [Thermoleophilia bacterium]
MSAEQTAPAGRTTAEEGASSASLPLTSQLSEALTHASWRLRRAAVKELAPLGLTFAQSRVLRMLSRSREPLRMSDIAARFEIAPRTATSMIDSLEAAGLVARSADPADRRSVLVSLAPDGLALVERMSSLRRQSAQELFGRLTAEQQDRLLELLTLLAGTASECDDRALAAGGET